MKTLRTIHFSPHTGTATERFTESGFEGSVTASISTLPAEQQAAIGQALAWLTSVAGAAGFATLANVWLTRLANIETYSTPEDPEDAPVLLSSVPAFAIGVEGKNAAGLTGNKELFSTPGEEAAAMGAIWDARETLLNG